MYFDALGSDSLEHTVMVFDSLPSNRFTFRTKEQIASICCCKGKKVVAVIKNVQNQQGASDCGLFSLVFATSLCFGDNPSEIQYNQKQLHEHVVSCFEAKVITPFQQNQGEDVIELELKRNMQFQFIAHAGYLKVEEWFSVSFVMNGTMKNVNLSLLRSG